MSDVIPSWYRVRSVGAQEDTDAAFGNLALRAGQVVRVVEPEDDRSLSKRYREYDVVVDHRENGMLAAKMYHNCIVFNAFGGAADYTDWTLRTDPKAPPGGGRDAQTPTFGSKVLILCVNGEQSSAWIVGGVKDQRQDDRGTKALGHHLAWEFNGVHFDVRDDGSWQLANRGKTAADGKPDQKRDAGAGTTVECKADGTWQVRTKDGAQSITIDHKAGTIKVDAKSRLTLVSDRIDVGQGADEHAVLGDVLKSKLDELIDILSKPDMYMTAVGPTVACIHLPELLKLQLSLEKILSHQTFLKREPR